MAGKSLAKKDIFGARLVFKPKNVPRKYINGPFSYFSDPYVRIDLNSINGDVNIDSVLTKTKKKVKKFVCAKFCIQSLMFFLKWKHNFLDTKPSME